MRWQPAELSWQLELLQKLPPSLDLTLLEEGLKLTPTERLEQLQQLSDLAEEVTRARHDRLP